MLLLAATEYAHRRLTRPRPERRLPLAPPPTLPAHEQLAQAGKSAIDGLRYQLLNALRGLAGGEPMLVKLNPVEPARPLAAPARFPAPPAAGDAPPFDILFVPGTSHAVIVGRLLIAAGCCAPCPHAHWVPNLAIFQLTDLGYAYYLKFQTWWAELPWQERLRIMLRE